jgi:hypothetical protein
MNRIDNSVMSYSVTRPSTETYPMCIYTALARLAGENPAALSICERAVTHCSQGLRITTGIGVTPFTVNLHIF